MAPFILKQNYSSNSTDSAILDHFIVSYVFHTTDGFAIANIRSRYNSFDDNTDCKNEVDIEIENSIPHFPVDYSIKNLMISCISISVMAILCVSSKTF